MKAAEKQQKGGQAVQNSEQMVNQNFIYASSIIFLNKDNK